MWLGHNLRWDGEKSYFALGVSPSPVQGPYGFCSKQHENSSYGTRDGNVTGAYQEWSLNMLYCSLNNQIANPVTKHFCQWIETGTKSGITRTISRLLIPWALIQYKDVVLPEQQIHCGESTGDRWIPITKGHWRGYFFYLMTSSCKAIIMERNVVLHISGGTIVCLDFVIRTGRANLTPASACGLFFLLVWNLTTHQSCPDQYHIRPLLLW